MGTPICPCSLTFTHDWLQQLEMGNEMCSIFFNLHEEDIRQCSSLTPTSYIDLKRLQQPRTLCNGSEATLPTTQIVVGGGHGEQSSSLPVISGVLQGSILGHYCS